ncbi:IgGFc-binding protein [Enhygromyxa salina]|nr:IgGFc-binding protein [Enhygromyxa salina]
MQRLALFSILSAFPMLTACGGDPSSEGDASSQTGITTAPETGGPETGDGDGDGDGDGGEGDGDGDPGDGDTSDSGVKFDMAELPDGGDDGGMAVPPSCDNIDDFPATSVGCEYFGVQVPSYGSNLPYGIAVGNPSTETATVTIEDMRGPGDTLREITTFELEPTDSVLTPINGLGGILDGSHMVSDPGLNPFAAFRVSSDVPITAMQLFPVGGGPSHVSEASMLLPVNALDQSYIASTWSSFSGSQQGFVVVVAIEDATTVFTDSGDYMLDAFDAWHFQSGADGTGYFVGADKPVAVFSGIECTMIPDLPWYACDHLEEQMLPLSAWGTHYVGARHPHRVPNLLSEPEDVYWRVIAAVDDTTITLNPAVAGNEIQLEQVGDWVEFGTPVSFEATGDKPFLLVQYMSGCYNVVKETDVSNSCDQGPTGDPYMMQSVPAEQWLTQLPFLTDTSYPRDFVTIIREQGTEVTLECLGVVSDDHFTSIPGTIYEVGQVDLDIAGNGGEGDCVDGAQFLTADKPVGVLVGGVDWATSYGYPGGLSLDALWEPPIVPQG